MFDIKNFITDHVTRGIMKSNVTGDIHWSITQIEEPSIKCTSENKEVLDAIGTMIAQIERAKKAEFSGSNSVWDLGLYAAQMGAAKKVASSSEKILSPRFEIKEVKSGDTELVLDQVPAGVAGAEIKKIYMLNGDSTLGKSYKIGAAASATDFKLDAATKTITLPTGITDGEIFIEYEYDAENAVEITNNSDKFPTAGKFIMEVIGHDMCDLETKICAYIIFPNAKLSSTVDYNFVTDSKHPFTLTCLQDYCRKDKKLFHIVIPQD